MFGVVLFQLRADEVAATRAQRPSDEPADQTVVPADPRPGQCAARPADHRPLRLFVSGKAFAPDQRREDERRYHQCTHEFMAEDHKRLTFRAGRRKRGRCEGRASLADKGGTMATTTICGEAELVVDGEHFERIVLEGICAARVSVAMATADFKAMLVPRGGRSRAESIVSILRKLANKGVEIRLLHAG